MKLDVDMNGYIFLSYETDDHFSGFPDGIEEALDSLESRMNDQDSDLPEISGISYRKHIAFDVGNDLEDYGERIQRYLRDFVQLAEHADRMYNRPNLAGLVIQIQVLPIVVSSNLVV